MRPIRVVMAKPGLDSHYRGAVVVSRYLMASGMEVVYIGNQLPEQIVAAAVEEDADVLGISSLSGNHSVMVPPILAGLREQGAEDVLVLVGGIVPADDADALRAAGVAGVFGPGTPLEDIRQCIVGSVPKSPVTH